MFDRTQPADTGTDNNSGSLGIFIRYLQAGVVHRHLSGGKGKMDKTVHLLYLFGFNVLFRVEAVHFPAIRVANLAASNCVIFSDTGPSCKKAVPALLDADTEGVIMPTPVMTTLFYPLNLSQDLMPLFLGNIFDSVFDFGYLLRIFIGNFDVESLFESHDQFDGIK